MSGGEFIRKIPALKRKTGISVHFDKRHGKGSHGTLHYGARKTTVKDCTKEDRARPAGADARPTGLSKKDPV